MITLSPHESQVLRRALDAYLPGLAFELSRIERPHERHELVVLERELLALRQRLAEEPSSARTEE